VFVVDPPQKILNVLVTILLKSICNRYGQQDIVRGSPGKQWRIRREKLKLRPSKI
jgi:hypothetical protein